MEIGDPVPVDPVYQSYVQYCQRIGCKPALWERWASPVVHYAIEREKPRTVAISPKKAARL